MLNKIDENSDFGKDRKPSGGLPGRQLHWLLGGSVLILFGRWKAELKPDL